MANSFPAVPADLQLQSVVYTFAFTSDANPATAVTAGPSLAFTGVNTGLGGTLAALAQGGSVQFTFQAPGQFGGFDQAAAETELSKIATDVFQLISDLTGTPVATLQQSFSVQRSWTWTDANGNRAAYTDTMPVS